MSTAHVVHFGCRLNQYESDSLAAGLGEKGLALVADPYEADYVVINTCTVTNRADQKNRSSIRSIHENNPRARIIVTGCYATTDAEEIRQIPGVYWVVGNLEKASIPSMVAGELGLSQAKTNGVTDGQFGYVTRTKKGHARAALKVQDGCNKSCSYCKIPHARGRGKSRNFAESLSEAAALIELGFHEITLTGVNIGWYKGERGETFEDLVESILKLPGDFMVRISSIEPGEVTERLAELFLHEKMAHFLHVPVQSGSRAVLKRMRRGYTPEHFRRWVDRVRGRLPNVHIGTDVIVGFPGESDEQFQETIDFCQQLQFANIHIFPFSLRQATPIQEVLNSPENEEAIHEINGRIIKERISTLQNIATQLAANYRIQTAGQVWRGIIEKKEEELITLTTENYIKLSLPAQDHRFERGHLVKVIYDKLGQVVFIE